MKIVIIGSAPNVLIPNDADKYVYANSSIVHAPQKMCHVHYFSSVYFEYDNINSGRYGMPPQSIDPLLKDVYSQQTYLRNSCEQFQSVDDYVGFFSKLNYRSDCYEILDPFVLMEEVVGKRWMKILQGRRPNIMDGIPQLAAISTGVMAITHQYVLHPDANIYITGFSVGSQTKITNLSFTHEHTYMDKNILQILINTKNILYTDGEILII